MKSVLLSHIQNKYPDPVDGSYADHYYRTDSNIIAFKGLFIENTATFNLSDNTISFLDSTYSVDSNITFLNIIPVEVAPYTLGDITLPTSFNHILNVKYDNQYKSSYVSTQLYFQLQVAFEQNNPYFIYNTVVNNVVDLDLKLILDTFVEYETQFIYNNIRTVNFIERTFATSISTSPLELIITHETGSESQQTLNFFKIDVRKLMQWVSWVCTKPILDEIDYNNVIPKNLLTR